MYCLEIDVNDQSSCNIHINERLKYPRCFLAPSSISVIKFSGNIAIALSNIT